MREPNPEKFGFGSFLLTFSLKTHTIKTYYFRKEEIGMSEKLERKYGLFTAICMVVGIVIGSGVFFKAQTILQKTGDHLFLGAVGFAGEQVVG